MNNIVLCYSGAASRPDSAQQRVPGHHQQHGTVGLRLFRIPHAHHHMVCAIQIWIMNNLNKWLKQIGLYDGVDRII